MGDPHTQGDNSSSPLVFDASGKPRIAAFSPRPRDSGSVSNSPLLQRAMVAQERAFSNRVIHFGRDSLFWKCATQHISEASYREGDMDDAALSQGLRLGLGILVQLTEIVSLHETWAKFMSKHSQMQLTCQRDRLVVISSLSRMLQSTARQPISQAIETKHFLSACLGILL